jgi:hypothetical protein
VTEASTLNFGLLIAYVLPGVVTVAGLSRFSDTARSWFSASSAGAPTVGGFLFLTLASVAAGLTVSAIRWLALDWIHHHTGVRKPNWNFSALQPNFMAFEGVVENHYRYYQGYGNMLVALIIAAFTQWPKWSALFEHPWQAVLSALILISLFFVASRDSLAKYYARSSQLLSSPKLERSTTMTNGWHKKHEPAKEITAKKPVRKVGDQAVTSEKGQTGVRDQRKK